MKSPLSVLWSGKHLAEAATVEHGDGSTFILLEVEHDAAHGDLAAKLVEVAAQIGLDLADDNTLSVEECIRLLGTAGLVSDELVKKLAASAGVLTPLVGKKVNVFTALALALALEKIWLGR